VIDVEVHTEIDIPPGEVDDVRRRVAALERYTDEPIIGARLTLRQGPGRSRNRYVADSSVLFAPRGEPARVLAAHVAGPSPAEATDAAVERLRRQLRRVVGSEVAERNEPDEVQKTVSSLPLEALHRPEAGLKQPEERQIVRRRTYADHPEATLEAAADMLDLDEEFHLFVHVRTSEDVVVHRRDDPRIGLIHPGGSILADETDDVVVAEPNRYSDPLTLANAREEMDIVNHRFLYYIDAEDNRGRVLYLRHDGDYGLVEPG
jgi:ribosome-associated translation inhibitor RaiA